ncbi:hypothetical protein [Haloarcula litorea]|uniref:hypothetical protein n=1 Tax=Haloarcula litorea TaxID=3032579 RepID=UPI0023E85AEC|nr:hypothetical protein [Halomicroarcula sp. GDY20]
MFDDEGPDEGDLVRVLVVLAIAIPIVIEVFTFGSLLSHYVVGGGDGGAATETPAVDGATEGEEILAATAPVERIERASVVTGDEGWTFTLRVAVENTGDEAYELRLGVATTRAGRTVAGPDATTGSLAPGATGSVTGSWLLPQGQRPASVTVTTVRGEGAAATTETHDVPIGDVPVSS